jgi:Toprim domain
MKADPASELVVVCEGVEDALSLALLFPHARVEAAGSLSLFASWQVPASAHSVRIAGDRDWDKPQAVKALEGACLAIANQAGAGVAVGLFYPPAGFKDWNEALCAQGVV